MLPIEDIGLCAFSRLASLGLGATCGLLFFAVGFLADSTAFPQGLKVTGGIQRNVEPTLPDSPRRT